MVRTLENPTTTIASLATPETLILAGYRSNYTDLE
jgi:hypothetical protein